MKTVVSLTAVFLALLLAATFVAPAQDLYTPKPSEPSQEPRKEPVKPPPAPKPVEESPFLGRLILTANCIGIDFEEVLIITTADANAVLGTAKMMFNSSKIVGGSAKGERATFIEEWDGKRTKWTARLSNGGQRMEGTVDGINIADHHCTFYGGRS